MNISLCFLCLSDDKRTVDIQNTHLQPFFEKLTELKIRNAHPLCYICHRRVQQCYQLVQLAQQTQVLLRSFQGNNSEILYIKSSLVDLSMTEVLCLSTPTNDIVIKEETAVKEENVNVAQEEYDPDDLITNLQNLKYIQSPEPKTEYEEDANELSSDTEYDIPLKCESDTQIVENHSFSEELDKKSHLAVSSTANKKNHYLSSINNKYHTNKSKKNDKSTNNDYNIKLEGKNKKDEISVNSKIIPLQHTTDSIFVCDICKHKCSNRNLLIKHIKVHTRDNYSATRIGDDECPNFPNKFLQKDIKKKLLSCDICHFKCLFKSPLIAHIRIHTKEKPFGCDMCNYKCTQKSSLKIHKRKHTREKPFSCDVCNYKCSAGTDLTRHKRTHTGAKPFSCDVCSYKSSNKGNLTRHKRTHTGEKPFSCDMCHFETAYKWYLQEHKKVHTK